MSLIELAGPWGASLRALLAQDPAELLQSARGWVQGIWDLVLAVRPQGLYEVLSHDTTLELLDPRGEVAVVERQQTVRFLQDGVEAFSDHAWGDGDLFAAYTCSPGVPVDFYQDGSRHTVLISLREVVHRGDTLSFRIQRTIRRGFLTPSESWETEIGHRTAQIGVVILFPRERRCRRATVTQHSASRTVVLGSEHFSYLEDGRQRVTWRLERPRLYERYALKWEW